jgi:hypothetical protein
MPIRSFCVAALALVFAAMLPLEANALPASAALGQLESASLVQLVGHKYPRRYYYDRGSYVRAPFTEVDTRRGTWVAAPFASVYSGRAAPGSGRLSWTYSFPARAFPIAATRRAPPRR